MTDNVKEFCNRVHRKLTTLEGSMDWLKNNRGPTWHFLQEKLDESRRQSEVREQDIKAARIALEQWFEQKKSDGESSVDQWRKGRDQGNLSERANQTEVHANYAMKIAEASIDDAERMILEAISARLEFDSVSGEDHGTSETPSIAPREEATDSNFSSSSFDLSQEQLAIVARMLNLLDHVCGSTHSGETTPIGFKTWVVDFFLQFTDCDQHSRQTLPPSSGLPFLGAHRDRSPASVMLSDRNHIRRMQLAADVHDHAEWSRLVAEYVVFLRREYHLENQSFPQTSETGVAGEVESEAVEMLCSDDRNSSSQRLAEQLGTQIAKWEERLQFSSKFRESTRWRQSTFSAAPTSGRSAVAVRIPWLGIDQTEPDMIALNSREIEEQLPHGNGIQSRKTAPRRSK